MADQKKESEAFLALKKKLYREHLVVSGLFGLAGGIFASGVSVGLCHVLDSKATWVIAPIAAVLAGAGVAYLWWKYKKPSDKKFAKRLDKELGLDQKVETMVYYSDQDSLLIRKQREDTERKLDEKKGQKLSFKLAALNIPAILLASGLFASSLFVPELDLIRQASSSNSSSWNQSDVDDFVSSVVEDEKDKIEEAEADPELKEKLYQILDDLREELKGDSDIDSRGRKIEIAKGKVDEAVDEANSKEEIGTALAKSSDEILRALGAAIRRADQGRIEAALQLLDEKIASLSGQRLIDYLMDASDEILKALAESKIPEGDALREALYSFAISLRTKAERYQTSIDLQSLVRTAKLLETQSQRIFNRLNNRPNSATDSAAIYAANLAVETLRTLFDKKANTVSATEEVAEILESCGEKVWVDLGRALRVSDDARQEKIYAAIEGIKADYALLENAALANELSSLAQDILHRISESILDSDKIEGEKEEVLQYLKDRINQLSEDLNRIIAVQIKNEELGEEVKKIMDSLKDPFNQGDESGDSSSQPGDSGESSSGESGDSGDSGDSGESGDTGDSTGDSGDSGETGDSSSGSSSGEESGNPGDSETPDEGAGSGEGGVDYGSDDHIFTDKGDTEYGDVLDDYHNGAIDDAINTGDDLDGALDDYFENLYGDGSGENNP